MNTFTNLFGFFRYTIEGILKRKCDDCDFFFNHCFLIKKKKRSFKEQALSAKSSVKRRDFTIIAANVRKSLLVIILIRDKAGCNFHFFYYSQSSRSRTVCYF